MLINSFNFVRQFEIENEKKIKRLEEKNEKIKYIKKK